MDQSETYQFTVFKTLLSSRKLGGFVEHCFSSYNSAANSKLGHFSYPASRAITLLQAFAANSVSFPNDVSLSITLQ